MIIVRRLIWDTWNIAHIAKHGVIPDEVEEVCENEPEDFKSYEHRIVLIGVTKAGRTLAAVLDPLGADLYYPVSARPASRKERRYYKAKKGGEQSDDKAA